MSAILLDAWSRARIGAERVDGDGQRWVTVEVPSDGDPREDVLVHLRGSVQSGGLPRAAKPAELATDVVDAPRGPETTWAPTPTSPALARNGDDEYVQPDAAPAVDWAATLAEKPKRKRGKR